MKDQYLKSLGLTLTVLVAFLFTWQELPRTGMKMDVLQEAGMIDTSYRDLAFQSLLNASRAPDRNPSEIGANASIVSSGELVSSYNPVGTRVAIQKGTFVTTLSKGHAITIQGEAKIAVTEDQVSHDVDSGQRFIGHGQLQVTITNQSDEDVVVTGYGFELNGTAKTDSCLVCGIATLVDAESGSNVEALAGSLVKARGGSQVKAKAGAEVVVYPEANVDADPRATLHPIYYQ